MKNTAFQSDFLPLLRELRSLRSFCHSRWRRGSGGAEGDSISGNTRNLGSFPLLWAVTSVFIYWDFFFFFNICLAVLGLSCPEACGILVPWPGIELTHPALEGEFLSTGPPGKSLYWDIYFLKTGYKVDHNSPLTFFLCAVSPNNTFHSKNSITIEQKKEKKLLKFLKNLKKNSKKIWVAAELSKFLGNFGILTLNAFLAWNTDPSVLPFFCHS